MSFSDGNVVTRVNDKLNHDILIFQRVQLAQHLQLFVPSDNVIWLADTKFSIA